MENAFSEKESKAFPYVHKPLISTPVQSQIACVWIRMLTLIILPHMVTFFPFLACNCSWRRDCFSLDYLSRPWVRRTSTVGWVPDTSEGAKRHLEPRFSLVDFSLGIGWGLNYLPRLKGQWEKAGPSSSFLGGGAEANKRREACLWTCTWTTLIWRAPLSEIPVNHALTMV